MLHICRIVQIAETALHCVCERLRRVGEGLATVRDLCDDLATVLQ